MRDYGMMNFCDAHADGSLELLPREMFMHFARLESHS